jgi:hypothetical protein
VIQASRATAQQAWSFPFRIPGVVEITPGKVEHVISINPEVTS